MPYKYARGSFLLINDKDNCALDLLSIMEARRRKDSR